VWYTAISIRLLERSVEVEVKFGFDFADGLDTDSWMAACAYREAHFCSQDALSTPNTCRRSNDPGLSWVAALFDSRPAAVARSDEYKKNVGSVLQVSQPSQAFGHRGACNYRRRRCRLRRRHRAVCSARSRPSEEGGFLFRLTIECAISMRLRIAHEHHPCRQQTSYA